MPPDADFNLAEVFRTVARAVPDRRAVLWGDRDVTFAEMDRRCDGVAHYLVSRGLGCRAERDDLLPHESGQDHVGLYLRNGNEYLESMIGGYRARVAPFNVNYRYVDNELIYLLQDSRAKALVYNAEFAPRVAAIRDRVPDLEILIQVADDSGHALLPDAVDYESVVATPPPRTGMPTPRGEDVFLLYTGGTTGMPKGVLWRQHDIFVSSMGGRPFGSDLPCGSYSELADRAGAAAGPGGAASVLLITPLIHGAAQWAAFTIFSMGGWVAFPDDVESLRPQQILRLAERERVMSIPVVGDAVARPLIDELERGGYDLSGLVSISNGGAALTQTARSRLLAILPNLLVIDAAGASESGLQMNSISTHESSADAAMFTPSAETGVISVDFGRELSPGEGDGWLARHSLIPLGYLGDADKTARTFPVIKGVRWSVPGDRARLLADGRIELLGRDSITINSGGEKIFVEEVERALATHPDVYDVVVVGRPSARWGSEVVAIIEAVEGTDPSDADLIDACGRHVARYKLPKAILRTTAIARSPSGKADYRWAAQIAAENAAPTA
ncbi:acyl-CoA synthetase [Candidatus Mycobacterium wuenschmannii]|uniref:Acyl-CoA synthetase n=1 Tax=Candidatus Mycobacterium wuenschmannii TaxID=3027808 RepID=A0ABY8VYT6_9MYCO|nr:acyl-CoA synthetase [Candidatus Mycobacterium wuenschmannii]WIM88086.1 acyl-CoA synthetase [Candidatus Mycobacterium wuenschmannii]